VIGAGLALMFASAVVGIAGISVPHFWLALTLLGVGWNFGFIGATAMVTQCHRPHERATVQSFNDFLVFGSMAIASFSSGSLLTHYGWDVVNLSIMPVIALAGALLLFLTIRQPIRAP
jgi:MFS family permease